jgi:hypothetical protein
MRLFFKGFIAMLVLAGLSGVMWLHQRDVHQQHQRDLVRTEVRRFQQQISLQAALNRHVHDIQSFPTTIDPMWFDGDLPRNLLLDDSHPWLEVASADDAELEHPRQRVAASRSLAKFWYNPGNGIVRARVPALVSDQDTLDAYNHVNSCELSSLFEVFTLHGTESKAH